jgi:uncharacterized protein YcsI (UPF0317 family)
MEALKIAPDCVHSFSKADIERARLAIAAFPPPSGDLPGRVSKRLAEAAMGEPNAAKRGKAMTPAQVRLACRAGELAGPTSGLCPGHAQANMVILPSEYAESFAEFCRLNPKPCPLLEMTEGGSFEAPVMAPGSDLRTDVPKYRIWRHGELVSPEVSDVKKEWGELGSATAFLMGCSFSFEQLLLEAGIPVRHIEQGCNVPMFTTNIQTKRSGPFGGPMVVSMRPMTPEQAERAKELTSHFARLHGSPVQIGSPETLGIKDLSKPDFGDPVEVREGEVPVFWACGVTSQLAAQSAKLPLFISHSPGHMLVLDPLNADLVSAE